MTEPRSPQAWLAATLLVALFWAPLPGFVALWYAVRSFRGDDAAVGPARTWLAASLVFGAFELGSVGLFGIAQWLWAGVGT